MTDLENREHQGVINPPNTIDQQSRIGDGGALQIQADYYQDAIDATRREQNASADDMEFIDLQERINGLVEARDNTIRQRELEEVREQQEEDISRLQRFKEWTKENMLGLSAIAITVAGLITTIIVGARKAVLAGAQATGKFAKAVANLAKKLGPLLAPLLTVIAQVISWGAKGIAWLSQNLWILAAAWFIYDKVTKK